MNTKRIVLSLAIVSFAALTCCVCWYVDYRLSLAPRLLFSIGFEDAKHFCPDLVAWRDGANPWEFVPNDIARSLCDHETLPRGMWWQHTA